MPTLAQFSKNIRSRASQVENGGTRLVKAVSTRALIALVRATPVDKGVTRSNWRVGIGAPTRSVIPAYAPGKKLGIGENANASAAIAVGRARINGVRKGNGGLTTAIYISNNTSHIEKLNRSGGTNQNSPGWIQAALSEARSEIREFRFFSR